MPSIRVSCPACHGALFHVDSELIGSEMECPECLEKFVVKDPAKTDDSPPARRAKKPTSAKRRDEEEDDSEFDAPRSARARNKSQGSGNLLAIIGLLSGIGGIVTCCCPISGLPFGLIGIVLGLISFKRSGISILGSMSIFSGSVAVFITIGWFFYAISTEPIEPETPEIIHRIPAKHEPANSEPSSPEPVRRVTTTTRTRTTYVKRFFAPRFPKFRK